MLLGSKDGYVVNFFPLVQVKDSGSRINPQDIPKVFTKFTQSQSLAPENSGGSGLGLAICKRYFVHVFLTWQP